MQAESRFRLELSEPVRPHALESTPLRCPRVVHREHEALGEDGPVDFLFFKKEDDPISILCVKIQISYSRF